MAKKDFKKNPAEMFLSTNVPAEDPAEKMDQESIQEAGFYIPKGYRLARENKSERMQLLVRPSLKAAIRKEAAAQGLSMNDLINNIFEEYLERKGE